MSTVVRLVLLVLVLILVHGNEHETAEFFKDNDLNSDGKITREEIVESFQGMDRGQGIIEDPAYYGDMASVLFDYYDFNNDRAITPDEFLKFSEDVEEQPYSTQEARGDQEL